MGRTAKLNQEQFIVLYADAISRDLTIHEFATEVGMEHKHILYRRKDYRRRYNLEFPQFKNEKSVGSIREIARWQQLLTDAENKQHESR